MSSPIEKLSSGIRTISDQWPPSHPTVASADDERDRYASVTDIVFSGLRSPEHSLPSMLTEYTGVRHGANVILGFYRVAALAAKLQDITEADRLRDLLLADQSFDQLAKIATNPNQIALAVEADYGIRTMDRQVDPVFVNKYLITDDGVELDDLDYAIDKQYLDLGVEYDDTVCTAHRNGALKPIYHSLVMICARDENLFPLTLAN